MFDSVSAGAGAGVADLNVGANVGTGAGIAMLSTEATLTEHEISTKSEAYIEIMRAPGALQLYRQFESTANPSQEQKKEFIHRLVNLILSNNEASTYYVLLAHLFKLLQPFHNLTQPMFQLVLTYLNKKESMEYDSAAAKTAVDQLTTDLMSIIMNDKSTQLKLCRQNLQKYLLEITTKSRLLSFNSGLNKFFPDEDFTSLRKIILDEIVVCYNQQFKDFNNKAFIATIAEKIPAHEMALSNKEPVLISLLNVITKIPKFTNFLSDLENIVPLQVVASLSAKIYDDALNYLSINPNDIKHDEIAKIIENDFQEIYTQVKTFLESIDGGLSLVDYTKMLKKLLPQEMYSQVQFLTNAIPRSRQETDDYLNQFNTFLFVGTASNASCLSMLKTNILGALQGCYKPKYPEDGITRTSYTMFVGIFSGMLAQNGQARESLLNSIFESAMPVTKDMAEKYYTEIMALLDAYYKTQNKDGSPCSYIKNVALDLIDIVNEVEEPKRHLQSYIEEVIHTDLTESNPVMEEAATNLIKNLFKANEGIMGALSTIKIRGEIAKVSLQFGHLPSDVKINSIKRGSATNDDFTPFYAHIGACAGDLISLVVQKIEQAQSLYKIGGTEDFLITLVTATLTFNTRLCKLGRILEADLGDFDIQIIEEFSKCTSYSLRGYELLRGFISRISYDKMTKLPLSNLIRNNIQALVVAEQFNEFSDLLKRKEFMASFDSHLEYFDFLSSISLHKTHYVNQYKRLLRFISAEPAEDYQKYQEKLFDFILRSPADVNLPLAPDDSDLSYLMRLQGYFKKVNHIKPLRKIELITSIQSDDKITQAIQRHLIRDVIEETKQSKRLTADAKVQFNIDLEARRGTNSSSPYLAHIMPLSCNKWQVTIGYCFAIIPGLILERWYAATGRHQDKAIAIREGFASPPKGLDAIQKKHRRWGCYALGALLTVGLLTACVLCPPLILGLPIAIGLTYLALGAVALGLAVAQAGILYGMSLVKKKYGHSEPAKRSAQEGIKAPLLPKSVVVSVRSGTPRAVPGAGTGLELKGKSSIHSTEQNSSISGASVMPMRSVISAGLKAAEMAASRAAPSAHRITCNASGDSGDNPSLYNAPNGLRRGESIASTSNPSLSHGVN